MAGHFDAVNRLGWHPRVSASRTRISEEPTQTVIIGKFRKFF